MRLQSALKKNYNPVLKNRQTNKTILIPVIFFCIFVILYFVAAAYYPGGSEVDRQAIGFSWFHNYWCDLLENRAGNGDPNQAKPIAIAAMIVLSMGILFFWYFIPRLFPIQPFLKRLMQVTGILSMIILAFLQDENHDPIINSSVILGASAMLLCLYGLLASGMYTLFALGLACLVFCGANVYCYYSKNWIEYLPIIQKISFFLFLLWFSILLFRLNRSK